jgi:hypothetical protein
LVAADWILDLDDRRAKVGELHSCEGSGHEDTQFQDGEVGKWPILRSVRCGAGG